MKFVNGYWIPDDDHNLVLDLLGPGGAHDVKVFSKILRYTNDQPKRVMVDVGANIGRWAKYFQKEYHQIFCFEPAHYNIECLKKNTEHDTNIHVRTYGLGESRHKASLSVAVKDHLGSTMAKPDPKGEIDIQRLDDQNLPDLDLLKIDVEGFETEVLRGGENIIKEKKPLIAIERHAFNYNLLGKTKKESHLYLQSLGYEMMFKLTRDCIYGIPNIHRRT
jgi:FkbM family methyltransferase